MKQWELINFCELDKYAIKSYCAIHNEPENKNLGDITKVDKTKLKPFNMICGGSPCQDFSVAGKQKGSVWTCKDCGHEYNPLTVHWSERDKCPNCHSLNIEKTRSSLLVEYLRVIRANKPNFGIYENVKNIVGKQFKNTFNMFIKELEEYGYNIYYQVLNAKNYGVPQNRERVYLIFIKKELDNGKFSFPKPFDNGVRLKDILEKEVDEKYYLSEAQILKIKINNKNALIYDKSMLGYENNAREYKNIMPTITSREYKEPRCVNETKLQCVKVNNEPLNSIICEQRYDEGLRFFKDNICGSLRTIDSYGDKRVIENKLKIRKITPKECWRLMGFKDKDIDKCIEEKISNTQLYKQAGNSIVVDVLYYILKELYQAMPYLFDDLKLSSFFSGIGAFEKALDRLYEDINLGNFTNPQID